VVNRSLLVVALALGAVALLGGLYSTLTEAATAPVGSAASRAVAPPATARADESAAALESAASVVAAAPDPETARLDARRQLYESVDALIQASELEKARKLLDEDVERYGNDLAPQWHDLEQSYRLMADCLEHPSAKLRLRAEAFVLVSQAVGLKSRILKACEPAPRR
jgi:hypothetical protein